MLLKVLETGSAALHGVWLLQGLQPSRENKNFAGDDVFHLCTYHSAGSSWD